MRASEDRLDVFLLLPGGDAFELVNDPAGIGALVERLDEEPPEVVAPKTTGGYEHPAPAAVVATGLAGAVVDP